MPYISETVKKNADKCKDFVGGTLTGILDRLDKNSVLIEEIDAVVKSLAVLAPHKDDFRKVYGDDPYDFFMKDYRRQR